MESVSWKILSSVDGLLLNYHVTLQSTTEISAAELLMGKRLHTRLELIHPNTTIKVIKKQGNIENSSTPSYLEVGDELFAKLNISVVRKIDSCFNYSYKLKTQSRYFICHHLDHLHVSYPSDNMSLHTNPIYNQ